MGMQKDRRRLLKYLFSFLAFGYSSILLHNKKNIGIGKGKSGLLNVGLSDAEAGAFSTKIKKIAVEEQSDIFLV